MSSSAPPVSRWRRLLAVLLSLTPGCGHVLLGRWKRGLVWLGAVVLVLASLPLLGFTGFLLILGMILGAVVDVLRLPPPEAGVPRAGWVLLGLAGFWAVSFVSRTWLAEPFIMPSASMRPTLLPGDQFFVDKRVGPPWRPVERGEVIVFRSPSNPNTRLIMRAVALEGETVAVRCGRLFLEGREVERRPSRGCEGPEGSDPSCEWEDELLGAHPHGVLRQEAACPPSMDFPASTGCPAGMETREAGCGVPARHVFVLGDNRDNAYDSRFWGALPVENVVASARFIHFSWTPEEGARWDRLGAEVR